MKLECGYKLLVNEKYMHWYLTCTPEKGRTYYLNVGDTVHLWRLCPDEQDHWDFMSLDNRVAATAPTEIIESMRRSYLRRNKQP